MGAYKRNVVVGVVGVVVIKMGAYIHGVLTLCRGTDRYSDT